MEALFQFFQLLRLTDPRQSILLNKREKPTKKRSEERGFQNLGSVIKSGGPANSGRAIVIGDTIHQLKKPLAGAEKLKKKNESLTTVQSEVTFPLDLVRRRKQLEGAGGRARIYQTGIFGTLKHIVRNEGFRGLYRGILPEYYKVVPGIGICFMTYETLRRLLVDIASNL